MDRFELLTEHCTKLEILDITIKTRDPEVWDHLSTLVRRNPRIKSTYICQRNPDPPKPFLEALSTCSTLRKLYVRMYELDEIRMELILDIAIRLEYLRISCFEIIIPKSLDKWSCFPVMEELKLNGDNKFPIPLELFRKCPNLRTLTWRTFEDTSDSVFDLCDLLKIHCPLLKSMTLFSESFTDKDLSLEIIWTHAISLGLCRMRRQTGEEKMVTQDWVCTHIQALAIFINGLEGKPEEWHRRILQQISKLKELKFLTLAPDESYDTHRSAHDGSNFPLRTGLDSLSSLKQLMALNISTLRQEMEEQDVRWMLEAWPKLLSVIGMLHPNKVRWEELCQILRERKVSSYVYSISENATDVESGEDTEEEEEEEEEEEVNEE
ncbi:hypothetical protein BGZ65_006778 [Modicella reniformis]|uniref:Uncharacterized protein n=1 Tax=Modicella reniformis TaxID=1440133 RepID=A0A9P6LR95_9FUNG|nr:hypothetical protein BGZ65_006778 [Modicella reniformis]